MGKHLFTVHLFVWLFLRAGGLTAQYAATRLYTVEDGLPMTEVVDVLARKDAPLLIGLNNVGVFAFDGQKSIPFQKDITGLRLLNAEGQGVWIRQLSKLVLVTPDTLLSWEITRQTESPDTIYPGGRIPPGQFLRTRQGFKLSLSNRKQLSLYRFDTLLQVLIREALFQPPLPEDNHWLVPDEEGQPGYFISRSRDDFRLYRIEEDGLSLIKKGVLSKTINFIAAEKLTTTFLWVFRGNELELNSVDGRQKLVLPLGRYLKKAPPLLFRYSEVAGRCLLLVQLENEKLLFHFRPDMSDIQQLRFPFPSEILGLDMDQAGVIWAASHSGLLRILPHFTNFFIEDNPDMLPDIHALAKAANGKIWFGSYGRGYGYIQDDRVYRPAGIPENIRVLPGTALTPDGRPMFIQTGIGDDRGIQIIDPADKLVSARIPLAGYYLARDRKGRLMFGTQGEGLLIQQNPDCFERSCWQQLGPQKGFGIKNVLTAVEDSLGRYWMARRSSGLAVYLPKPDTILNFLVDSNQIEKNIWAMHIDQQERIWVGADQGLFLFSPPANITPDFRPDQVMRPVSEAVIPGTGLRAVKSLGEEYLVLGTTAGMALLDLQSFQRDPRHPVIFAFDKMSSYTGQAAEQNAIWVSEDKNIWIANDAGITRVNTALFQPDTTPPVAFIQEISSYGERFGQRENGSINLSPKNTNVYIRFGYRAVPSLSNKIAYRYRLNEDSVGTTTEPEVRFTSLRPGKYTFTLYAQRDGILSEPVTLSFRIARPFVETPWFYLLLLGFGIALYAYFYRQRRLQEKRRQQLLALRVQTVVNQLNPHFINNALSWIQARSLEHQDTESVAIISKLASNIKTIFRNSREKRAVHKLKEELKLVRNYLAIQKARFGDQLNFTLPDPGLIDTWGDRIDVPLMLLQIHCENAVEHGIRNQPEGGWVRIRMEEHPTRLKFFIEDNGIGRQKAREIRSLGTQQGVRMLSELIYTFNKNNLKSIRQEYEDLPFTNDRGQPCGTRVILTIPKQYSYALTHS